MTKVNSFQCKAIAIMSFSLDITGVPEPPLITLFDRVIFNLIQVAVISLTQSLTQQCLQEI